MHWTLLYEGTPPSPTIPAETAVAGMTGANDLVESGRVTGATNRSPQPDRSLLKSYAPRWGLRFAQPPGTRL